MAISKVERLMNLVIALLSTRNYLPAERIRRVVAGYSECASDEAFSRMFERDKTELRDLGVPLEVGRISRLDPTEGYRIKSDDYALPDITLDQDEAAAVAVAVQLWQSPELITATQGALLKLRAAGIDIDAVDSASGVSITSSPAQPGLRGSEAVLGTLLAAIDAGQAVRFQHRGSRIEPYTPRTVEPWGVVTDRGRWYLVGRDRSRDAVRTFRVSRIGAGVEAVGPTGAVTKPDDVDLRAVVARVVGEATTGLTARIWLADGRATALRRAGAAMGRATVGGREGDVVSIEIGSLDRLAREVAGHGADAVALEPSSLRDEVIARLGAQAVRA